MALASISAGGLGSQINAGLNQAPLTPVADQRHHLRGAALQPFDAVGDRLAAKVEDQLMHARGRERVDVACDVVWLAGEAAAGGGPARGGPGVPQRLVGDVGGPASC